MRDIRARAAHRAASGLLPDDRVVISQLANPRDGMLVAEREVAGSSREPLQTADARKATVMSGTGKRFSTKSLELLGQIKVQWPAPMM
jgi:hypothetical protein